MSTPPLDMAVLAAQLAQNPALTAELQALLAAAQPASSAVAAPSIQTQGGAGVGGSVSVQGGGHFIGRDFILIVQQCVPSAQEAEAVTIIDHYLKALAKDLAGLKLGDIDNALDPTRNKPLELTEIYVPLDTELEIPEDAESLGAWLANPKPSGGILTLNGMPLAIESGMLGIGPKMRRVSVIEALDHHRELTLLGKPGSGKSTCGAYVLLSLAQAWHRPADELTRLGDAWRHGTLLPIRVVLRRFAETLPAGQERACAGDLWNFIARDLQDSGIASAQEALATLQRIARNHGALFLLDGLDECGSTALRGRVEAAVRDLMDKAGEHCRFLLTARPYAWPRGTAPDQGVYMLADFSPEQSEQFIRSWYSVVEQRGWKKTADIERKISDLLSARDRDDLRHLASNPLLLTLMAVLHTNKGHLPDDRADLYDEAVELLLLRWNQEIGDDAALLSQLDKPGLTLGHLRAALEKLALEVHRASAGQEGAADIGEMQLLNAWRPLLGTLGKAELVVEYVERRAGLLIGLGQKVEGGERQFTFPHRTFQEFLAACALSKRQDLAAECARLARDDRAAGHWDVVLPLAARIAGAERGAGAADALIEGRDVAAKRRRRTLTTTDWRAALLAGQQLKEIGCGLLRSQEHTACITERVADWLVELLKALPPNGLAAPQRALAGDVLSRLGDPRFDPQQYFLPCGDGLGFVPIPGRDDLRFAQYPVTVAQFRAFVEHSGFELGYPDCLRDPDHRPVRWVNHTEALAYCEWLTGTGGLPDGWRSDLPDEHEWEHASRGGQPKEWDYWWAGAADPERANYGDSGIGDTSVVGCFPANDYGLYDMLGNVWEWTTTPEKPEFGSERDEARVVRGGSWGYPVFYLRCAGRHWILPHLHGLNLGFRVVLRCSPG